MKPEKLILGTVQLGLNYGINNKQGKPSREEAFSILEEAQASGIKYLDTAAAYGDSEEIIGACHQKIGEQFSVLTKFHLKAREDIGSMVGSTLKRLAITTIDTLFYHSYNDFIGSPNTLRELVLEVEKGRVKKIGVSVYTNQEIERLLDVKEVKVIQAPFNLLDNEQQRADIFKQVKQRGKEIHTRSVFLQGLFFKEPKSISGSLLPLRKDIERIKALANSAKITLENLALNYALSKSYIDRVLVGVDNVKQLRANLKAINTRLPQDVTNEIDQIGVEDISLLNPSTWKI